MTRAHDTHPKTEIDPHLQMELNALRQAGVRPAFFVDSSGVATPGNVIRGEGFTMRNGDTWPRYRSHRPDIH